jgi:hypothetical protein
VVPGRQVDLGHPGLDNAFLIDTGDPIAQCPTLRIFTINHGNLSIQKCELTIKKGEFTKKKCDLSLKHQTNRILIIKNGDFRLKTMEFLYGCSEHGANDPIQILGSNHWILPARLSLSRLGCRQNTMVSGQKAGQ